jgi:hypothetical protein
MQNHKERIWEIYKTGWRMQYHFFCFSSVTFREERHKIYRLQNIFILVLTDLYVTQLHLSVKTNDNAENSVHIFYKKGEKYKTLNSHILVLTCL